MYAVVQRGSRPLFPSDASMDCEKKCDQAISQETKTDSKLRAHNSREMWYYDHFITICTFENSYFVTTAQRAKSARADCTDQQVKTTHGNNKSLLQKLTIHICTNLCGKIQSLLVITVWYIMKYTRNTVFKKSNSFLQN